MLPTRTRRRSAPQEVGQSSKNPKACICKTTGARVVSLRVQGEQKEAEQRKLTLDRARTRCKPSQCPARPAYKTPLVRRVISARRAGAAPELERGDVRSACRLHRCGHGGAPRMRGRPLAAVAAVGVWAARHRLVAFPWFRGRSVLQRAVGRRPGARVAGRPTRACPRRSGAHVRNPRPFCFERARMRPRHAAAPHPRHARRRGNVRGARGVRRAVRTVGSVLSRSQPSRRLLRQRRRLSPAHSPDKPRLPRRPRLPRSIERGRLCPFRHVWRIRQVLQRRTGNTGLRGLAARRIRRIPAVGVRHEGTVRRRAVPTAAQGMPLPHARIHVQSGRGVRPAESGLCREHRQHVPPPRVDAAV